MAQGEIQMNEGVDCIKQVYSEEIYCSDTNENVLLFG
jgi:hypothetical protein